MRKNSPPGARGGHGGCALVAALLITGSVLTAATASASPSTGAEPDAAAGIDPTIEAAGSAFAAAATITCARTTGAVDAAAAPPVPVPTAAPASLGEPVPASVAPPVEDGNDPGTSPDDAMSIGASAPVDSDTDWSVVESTLAVAEPAEVSASSESASTVTTHTDAAGGTDAESVRTESRWSQRTVTETRPQVERSESKVTVHVSTETHTEHTSS